MFFFVLLANLVFFVLYGTLLYSVAFLVSWLKFFLQFK